MIKISKYISFIIFTLIVTACKSTISTAPATVEKYLNALSNKEEALMISYTCPEKEFEALLEYDSFALVQNTLKGLVCEETNSSIGIATVVCQGSIEATYGGEQRSFDLADRTYQVISDNDKWLVCGYTK